MVEAFKGLEGKNPYDLYAQDRQEASHAGVLKDINFPYFHQGSDKGVLLIHGLAASPKEVEPLFSVLKDRGLTVYAPRVAGHGSKDSDMNKTTYEDWYNSLKYGYFAIKNSCREVNVMGQSNGGLLASLVALLNPVDTLCLMAPAFKVNLFIFPLVKILHKISKGGAPRVLSEEKREFNYKTFPFEALYQMMMLQDFLRSRLVDIKGPAHMLLSITKNDRVISTKAAMKAAQRMMIKDTAFSLFDNKKYGLSHIMTEYHVRDSVIAEIADWVENPEGFLQGDESEDDNLENGEMI